MASVSPSRPRRFRWRSVAWYAVLLRGSHRASSFARAALAPAAPLALAGVAVIAATGCNKTEEKKVPQEENKARPVPSDLVFNDFLPSNGNAGGLAVRVDGGVLDGGAPSASGTDEAGAGGAAPAAERTKLLEPGAEPRAARKYAFVAGRVDKRVVTIRQSAAAEGQAMNSPALAFSVEFVPRDVKPTGARMEMKLAKVELAERDKVDPRMAQAAAQELAAFAGLMASFEVSSRGEIGQLALKGTDAMQREGAEVVLEAFQQVAELVFVPLPAEPIGVGAKWESDDAPPAGTPGAGETAKRTLELKEAGAQGATIVASTIRHVPKRPYPDPRLRGATVEVQASGSYTYVTSFDHVPSKVTGEQTQKVSIEVPDPSGSGEKKTMHQDVKVSHTLQ